MHKYKYARAALTVDIVVISQNDNSPRVLLIKRKNPPFKGQWALPGGFMNMNETLREAASRELREETRLTIAPAKFFELSVCDAVARDPRERVVSHPFLAFYDSPKIGLALAADDAAEVKWCSLHRPPKDLAFDHKQILAEARSIVHVYCSPK